MPNIIIPKEFAGNKKLVAVPERVYRELRQFLRDHSEEEIASVKASLADVGDGRVIEADSFEDALKEARANGWIAIEIVTNGFIKIPLIPD